jgi:hypothetical protein
VEVEMTAQRRRWQDLGPGAKAAIVVGGFVQLGLLGAALTDISRRRPDQLNGPRWLWTGVSFINFAGPITYFVVGRRKSAP